MTARNEIMNNGVVRLRMAGKKECPVGTFTLPRKYAQHVAFGSRFHVVPVADGFLFRYLGPPESVEQTTDDLPEWMKAGSS